MTCVHSVALGAYILGADSGKDRHAVEIHLRECQSCRDELVDLAALPGLLNRISAGDDDAAPAAAGPRPVPPPPPARGRRAALHRWQRRSLGVAAVLVLVVAGVVGGVLTRRDGGTADTAVAQVVLRGTDSSGQVTATAALTSRPWGTEIRLRLHGVALDTRCQLVVNADGGSHEGTGWWATGTYVNTLEVPTATSIRLGEIASLDVRTVGGRQLVHLPVRARSPGATTPS